MEFQQVLEENAEHIVPIKLGDIPEYVVKLGLIGLAEYLVYSACGHEMNINQLSRNLNIGVALLIRILINLAQNRIVEFKYFATEECDDIEELIVF